MRISDCSSDVCSSELPTFLGDPSTKSRGVSFGITIEERPHCPRSLNRRELPLQFSDFLIHIPAFKCQLGELIMAGFPFVLESPVENVAGVGIRGLRSEERGVGKECVSPCGSRGSPEPENKKWYTHYELMVK